MGFIADIFTANKAADAQKDASRDAAQASQYATDKTVGLNKEIFDKIWAGTQVQRDAGDAATRMMAQLMGLSLPGGATQPQLGRSSAPPATGAESQPFAAGPLPGRISSRPDLTQAIAMEGGAPITGYGEIGRNALAPVREAQGGMQPVLPTGNALNPVAAQPFDVTAWLRSTPGYEANYNEGMRALNAGLASSGRLYSGDALRETQRYGQQYADRIFGDQFNRLAAIAGAGQTATSQGSQAGQSYAGNAGNALQNNAQNLGSSYANAGDASSWMWGNVGGTASNALSDAYRGYKKDGLSGLLGGLF